MVWLPTARALVVTVATPEDSVGAPSGVLVVVSVNCTLPVGVPLDEVTEAVKVTAVLRMLGVELLSIVTAVELPAKIVSTKVVELVRKFPVGE
jgi:hypothetical protein